MATWLTDDGGFRMPREWDFRRAAGAASPATARCGEVRGIFVDNGAWMMDAAAVSQ